MTLYFLLKSKKGIIRLACIISMLNSLNIDSLKAMGIDRIVKVLGHPWAH